MEPPKTTLVYAKPVKGDLVRSAAFGSRIRLVVADPEERTFGANSYYPQRPTLGLKLTGAPRHLNICNEKSNTNRTQWCMAHWYHTVIPGSFLEDYPALKAAIEKYKSFCSSMAADTKKIRVAYSQARENGKMNEENNYTTPEIQKANELAIKHETKQNALQRVIAIEYIKVREEIHERYKGTENEISN